MEYWSNKKTAKSSYKSSSSLSRHFLRSRFCWYNVQVEGLVKSVKHFFLLLLPSLPGFFCVVCAVLLVKTRNNLNWIRFTSPPRNQVGRLSEQEILCAVIFSPYTYEMSQGHCWGFLVVWVLHEKRLTTAWLICKQASCRQSTFQTTTSFFSFLAPLVIRGKQQDEHKKDIVSREMVPSYQTNFNLLMLP